MKKELFLGLALAGLVIGGTSVEAGSGKSKAKESKSHASCKGHGSCEGKESCKGKSSCKGKASCKGKSSCKGHGGCGSNSCES